MWWRIFRLHFTIVPPTASPWYCKFFVENIVKGRNYGSVSNFRTAHSSYLQWRMDVQNLRLLYALHRCEVTFVADTLITSRELVHVDCCIIYDFPIERLTTPNYHLKSFGRVFKVVSWKTRSKYLRKISLELFKCHFFPHSIQKYES